MQWKEAVIQRVEMYNVQLPVPLCQRECACIGNSIAKWTHKRFTESGFEQYVADTHTPEIQAERGRRGGKKNRSEVQATKGSIGGKVSRRTSVADSARSLKPWESLGISRATYYRRRANETK